MDWDGAQRAGWPRRAGRHIAIIWACTKCHGYDLSGRLFADDPFLGTILASNLTSGKGGIKWMKIKQFCLWRIPQNSPVIFCPI